jgi:glycosyltransferase involved in cell wall biosynthesis
VKVLFIVTAYPRHDSDVITPWMGETIARLRKSGVDVEVLAPSYRGAPATSIQGVKVHRFRYAPAAIESLTHDAPALDTIAKNPLYAALVPFYLAAGTAAAGKIAKEGNFDVVHAFWPIPHGVFAIAAKQQSRAALVSTFFSSELNWTGVAKKIFAPILKRIIDSSDAITVISSFTEQRLRDYAPGVNTTIIPFGAAAVSRDRNANSRLRAMQDSFELLFVGRLVRRKGVDVLLRAVKILESDPRLHVRIVGGGPEQVNLERKCLELALGDRVTFEGVVDSSRIDALFAECDALVLPAIITETGETEGLGVVLIEAMGYGKPVIASAAGGIVDIVKDNETGILVPPGDAEALAKAISRAMDQPDQLARIARKGTQFAESAFGWDTIVSDLRKVYKTAVEHRHATDAGASRK